MAWIQNNTTTKHSEVTMSLDLNKLANKLDEALIKETTETLTKFLNNKKINMNDTTKTSIELAETLLRDYFKGFYFIPARIFDDIKKIYQAEINEAYNDGREAAIIKDCATESTSAASGVTEAFAIGYDQGYKRAVDYMKETLNNKIEIKEDANNEFRKGTANTTGTTFLCTEFVSDQLFYKGTLPHCMRCGKPQYQHPIISHTI